MNKKNLFIRCLFSLPIYAAISIALSACSDQGSWDISMDQAGRLREAKPVISLSTPAGTAIDENNGAGVVRVILSKTYHSDVTVLLSCSGSASAGTDYSANATTVVIPAGETSVDVSITSIDDSVSEGDENVIVAIDSVVNGTEDGTQQTEFSITDDDVAKASLSLAGGGSIAEDGSSETVTVSLSSTSVSDITVNLAYSGNAANTADYTRSADTVTIPAGSTSTTFQVASAADALDETDETVTVDIDSVAGGMEDGVQQQTITITDDDDPPQVQMDLFVSGGLESGGSLTLPVSLSAESGLTVSVDYTVTGTATAGTDYTPASGTLTIPAGSTSGTINITIIDDTIPEADESLTVTLSNPVNSSLGGNTSYAHGIINDDDPPQVQVGAPMGMGDESFSSLTLQVNLSAVSTLDVSVDYTVTGTATSGSDYTSASSTLTIPAGSTSGTISITIINDTLFEGNESLNIALTNPVNAGLGSSTSYSYTILDNDNPPQVQLGSTTGSGDETSSSLTLQVNLSAVSGLAASVDYAVTGTATSGSDYTPASGTVTIPAGSTSGTISITIIDDALEEDDESLNITISNPVNASLGLYTNYNYTIVENDRKGPAITAAGYYDTDSNGFLDHIKITLDKTVDDSTFDGYGGTNALGSVTSKWAIAGYSNVRLDTSYSGDVDDDTVIWLAFDEQANTYDTGNTPELTVTDASLTDLNTGNCYFNTSTAACSTQTDADLAAGGVTETDKAPPVIVDAVSDIDFSLLFVMFSEPVDSNGGTCDTSLNADDLSYNNASNNNVSDKTPICIDCTACSDSSVSFVLDGNFAAADAGTDTINAVLSSVYDSADNSAEVTPLVITAVSDYAGFYPLNGNGNDESGNSNPFTSLAFEDKNRDGAEPGSYFLNEALANVLKITDSSNFDFTTEMTISIWVKVSNADSEPKIIGKVNAAMNRGYVLGVSFNEFSSQVWDSAGTLYTITSGTVLSGTWTHLAMTWNTGGKLRGYVNGELVQEVDTGANPIAVGGIGANFCAGAAPWDGSSNQMEGNIDDIRMYGRELSSTEISVLSSLPAD